MKSALQKEAERQVLSMHNELSLYRKFMSSGFSKPGQPADRSPAWHISHETFDGDFALDEVLAQKLASNIVSSKPEAEWLTAYLDGTLLNPSAGIDQNVADVVASRGNAISNANAMRQTYEATRAQARINGATAKITAGKAQSIKINSHMTLYNAEKSTRKPPILRVRIDKMKIEVISPMFDKRVRTQIWRGGINAHAKEVRDMSRLAGLTSKMKSFNCAKAGGILTFAPTVVFDFIDSIKREENGGRYINWRQFANVELKNQPGNLAGSDVLLKWFCMHTSHNNIQASLASQTGCNRPAKCRCGRSQG